MKQQPKSPMEMKKEAPIKVTPSSTLERPVTNQSYHQHQHHQVQPMAPIYVKKEDRTVASLLGDDDDDDEIGLDELDDDYLNAADSPSPPPSDFRRHNSMTRKQANSFVLQRSMLPPPLENCIVESDLEVLANAKGMKPLHANQKHYHVHSHVAHSHAVHLGGGHYTNRQHNNPIQIQFHAGGLGGSGVGGGGGMMQRSGGNPATSPSTENIVLAPPPQFSDGVEEVVPMVPPHHGHYHGQQQKLGPNVRIVGAVPKSTNRF